MRGLSGRAALRGLMCRTRAPVASLLARSSSGGPSWTMERTLVAVKPDGVQRRLVGDVIQRFERRGFKLVGMKMLQAPESILAEHYHDLQRKPFYPALISYMSSGPVVAMVWEGPNVVCTSRAMIGHTNSAEAAPGTIRGDFSIHISRYGGPNTLGHLELRASSLGAWGGGLLLRQIHQTWASCSGESKARGDFY
ncbi:nucleoside diphosphate kinase, mitochondrial isoform X1 [Delphinapterus leucas]|uniref:Nucleoside diphosphate kinase, mitochondrial n=1 Tax=Delphinapterus leucas TaxID=9749 RepID=A0A2Y9Q3R6_DELLE|nr:nucleoside diphosphate kinase, mitochondrial isoform X1 [Delphinapterus leucas]